jgi:hypothetical protein
VIAAGGTVSALAPATTAEVGPEASLGIVDVLLRDRGGLLARIDRGDDLAALVRALIATIAVCMALVGAAIGGYRGGAQIAYAAIKMPLVMLLTAALSAPTLTALNLALGRPASPGRDVARVLAALAFGSLLLLALAPLLLLAPSIDLPYHQTILLLVGCFAVGGVASVGYLSRGVRAASPRCAGLTVLSLLVVFTMVGSQMAWTLRPYLVRPRTHDIPFVRAIEGGLLESVAATFWSAQDVYDVVHRDRATAPGDAEAAETR